MTDSSDSDSRGGSPFYKEQTRFISSSLDPDDPFTSTTLWRDNSGVVNHSSEVENSSGLGDGPPLVCFTAPSEPLTLFGTSPFPTGGNSSTTSDGSPLVKRLPPKRMNSTSLKTPASPDKDAPVVRGEADLPLQMSSDIPPSAAPSSTPPSATDDDNEDATSDKWTAVVPWRGSPKKKKSPPPSTGSAISSSITSPANSGSGKGASQRNSPPPPPTATLSRHTKMTSKEAAQTPIRRMSREVDEFPLVHSRTTSNPDGRYVDVTRRAATDVVTQPVRIGAGSGSHTPHTPPPQSPTTSPRNKLPARMPWESAAMRSSTQTTSSNRHARTTSDEFFRPHDRMRSPRSMSVPEAMDELDGSPNRKGRRQSLPAGQQHSPTHFLVPGSNSSSQSVSTTVRLKRQTRILGMEPIALSAPKEAASQPLEPEALDEDMPASSLRSVFNAIFNEPVDAEPIIDKKMSRKKSAKSALRQRLNKKKREKEKGNDDGAGDTRSDASPLHMIPWDQRATLPGGGSGASHLCACCTAPNFWARIEWVFRATFLAILPCSVLAHHEDVSTKFVEASIIPEMAFWVASPTFGDGLREGVYLIKGYLFSTILMLIVLAIQPTNKWVWLAFFSVGVFLLGAFADAAKRTSGFVYCVLMLSYIADEDNRSYYWLGRFMSEIAIGLGFGIFALVFPRPTWSLDIARSHCCSLGNVVAVSVQGIVHSMWAQPLERELHLVKILQLRQTMRGAIALISKSLAEAEYEPNTGIQLAEVKYLKDTLETLVNIVHAAINVIVQVNTTPTLLDSPSAKLFGDLIAEPLAVFSNAIDSTLLKIADRDLLIDEGDMHRFRYARDTFHNELLEVRETVMSSPEFETSEADIVIGYFFFSLQQLCDVIDAFDPPVVAPSHFVMFFTTPFRDIVHGLKAYRANFAFRTKEAFKLCLAMTLSAGIQLLFEGTSPVGTPIIAFVSNVNAATTFNYSSLRLLGTVVGSVTSVIAADASGGHLSLLLTSITCLSIIGCFVQSSRAYYAAGNAVVFSALSVLRSNATAVGALNRIQQNVFAIMLYFAIASLLWPVRANTSIRQYLTESLRDFRGSISKLMDNLSLRDQRAVEKTIEGVRGNLRSLRAGIRNQESLISAAVVEPTMTGNDFPEQPFRRVLQAQENLLSLATTMRHAFGTFLRSEDENSIHWEIVDGMEGYCRDFSDVVFAIIDLHLLSISKTTQVPAAHLVRLRVQLISISNNIVEHFASHLDQAMTDALAPMTPEASLGEITAEELIRRAGGRGQSSSSSPYATMPRVSSLRADYSFPPGSSRGPTSQSSRNRLPAVRRTQTPPGPDDPPFELSIDGSGSGSDNFVDHHSSSFSLPRRASAYDARGGAGGGGLQADGSGDEIAEHEMILSNADIHSVEAWVFGTQAITTEIGFLQRALLEMQHAEELDEVF